MFTEENCIRDVLEKLELEKYSYLFNPMERIMDEKSDQIFPPEMEELARVFSHFDRLKFADFRKYCVNWKVEDVLNGVNHLEKLVRKQKVVYEIYEDSKKNDTGLTSFPLEGRHKFVLVCPGGGYQNVCTMGEGFPIAKRLNDLGHSVFVLQYRVNDKAKAPAPMEDVAQALRFIMAYAEEWSVDVEDYAIMGFSAGGHLAASFGTKSVGYARYHLPKPGAVILGYPVITMGKNAHEGSRNFLLKEDAAKQEMINLYSIEKQIDSDYPRTFLWQCEEDDCVPFTNSKLLAQALDTNGVPYVYETFPGTAHGWGAGTGTAAEGWLERAVDFWTKGYTYILREGENQWEKV